MVNILQHEILTDFVYPFLLVFFIVFAVLEKTKIFGEGKKQINALVAFVIGLIFVGAVSPKLMVENLILFLTVAIVVVFVVMLIWGFITGGESKFSSKPLLIIVGFVVVIAVLIALLIITGLWDGAVSVLFQSDWSSDVWTNIVFIVVIALALTAVLIGSKAK
jgi:hypothetical protein